MTYEDDHQVNNYTEPNWTDDEYFGSAISCGKVGVWQKDTLSLADVDYGHSGRWTMSVWFRHAAENFPGYSREQFLGHGDPIKATSTNNQFHVQLEKSSRIRTIMRDNDDIDRCARQKSFERSRARRRPLPAAAADAPRGTRPIRPVAGGDGVALAPRVRRRAL